MHPDNCEMAHWRIRSFLPLYISLGHSIVVVFIAVAVVHQQTDWEVQLYWVEQTQTPSGVDEAKHFNSPFSLFAFVIRFLLYRPWSAICIYKSSKNFAKISSTFGTHTHNWTRTFAAKRTKSFYLFCFLIISVCWLLRRANGDKYYFVRHVNRVNCGCNVIEWVNCTMPKYVTSS